MRKSVQIDGNVRTDINYPAGFQGRCTTLSDRASVGQIEQAKLSSSDHSQFGRVRSIYSSRWSMRWTNDEQRMRSNAGAAERCTTDPRLVRRAAARRSDCIFLPRPIPDRITSSPSRACSERCDATARSDSGRACMSPLVPPRALGSLGSRSSCPSLPLPFCCRCVDVISLPKTSEQFRLLYDVKGRFVLHRITPEEATYKLVRVQKVDTAKKASIGHNPFHTGQLSAIPYVVTHDGRTIRFADPAFRTNDTVKLDIKTGRPVGHIKFEVGQLAMITRGANVGRVGSVVSVEAHPGSFDIAHLKVSG